MAPKPLPRDLRQLQTIILAAPVAVVSSYILYKRLFLGEEQRKLEPPDASGKKLADTFVTRPEGRP
ncbi:hypothetical protein M407DRAFT_20778 [Tulasnella calospora MUT 4182]|uniref:Uncharacterized protein n=1 Tax=Tulasnella calospora MUT 4182 TaxID=1051891 RepID=A0A0C3M8R0_9AGAM|nr:hypothetical protein M407DRAFT_20778 [Tulasnella calospora MUT 4182]